VDTCASAAANMMDTRQAEFSERILRYKDTHRGERGGSKRNLPAPVLDG
jgi:hypothetical protein